MEPLVAVREMIRVPFAVRLKNIDRERRDVDFTRCETFKQNSLIAGEESLGLGRIIRVKHQFHESLRSGLPRVSAHAQDAPRTRSGTAKPFQQLFPGLTHPGILPGVVRRSDRNP